MFVYLSRKMRKIQLFFFDEGKIDVEAVRKKGSINY